MLFKNTIEGLIIIIITMIITTVIMVIMIITIVIIRWSQNNQRYFGTSHFI